MRPTIAPFPKARLRRARKSPAMRGLVRENALTVDDLIWPIFVRDRTETEEPVPSMPGVFRPRVAPAAPAPPRASARSR